MCSNLTRVRLTIVGESRRTVPATIQFPKVVIGEIPEDGIRSEMAIISFFYNSSVDGQTVTATNTAGDTFFLVRDGGNEKLPFVIISDKSPDGQQYGTFAFESGQNIISTSTSVTAGDPTKFTQTRQIYLLITKDAITQVPQGTYTGSILFVHSTNF